MWATAGIGMAIGGGMYFLGVAATILVLIGLEVLTLAFGKIGLSSISITFYTSDKANLEKVVEEIHTKKYHLVQYNATEESIGGVLMYKAEIVMKVKGHREQSGLFVFIQKLDNISQLKVE
jgi:putative Mg2+ transporter-C (MgtC) family protein